MELKWSNIYFSHYFMKYIIFSFLFLLFSCTTYTNRNIEINMFLTNNIFEYLFTDIYEDYNEYKNKIGYEVIEKHNSHYLLPEIEITVKHECFSITYYPSYYEYEKYGTGNQGIFIRQGVEINKKNNEVMLGKYIGENIEILLEKFNNEIEGIYEYESHKYYSYGYHKNSTSNFRRIGIGISVVNNIIMSIFYGYEI